MTVKLVILLAVVGMAVWLWSNQASPSAPTWDRARVAALTADLADAEGMSAPSQTLLGTKPVLIYFSASWCPPCRAFTPELVAYYKAHGGGSAFQLLFVSNDQSEAAMHAYMHDDAMPWWGVRYHSASAKALTQAYCGRGIPCLVMLDPHGKVLADSFVSGRYVGPHEVLKALSAVN